MTRASRLAAAVLFCTSCASWGSGVRVERNVHNITPCRELGEIHAQGGVPELKKKARARGANTVLVVVESVSVQGGASETAGIAYHCP
jgi:hypothetical protein